MSDVARMIVLKHPLRTIPKRGVVDEVSLGEWSALGWQNVGTHCGVPGSTLTDVEWAAANGLPHPGQLPTLPAPEQLPVVEQVAAPSSKSKPATKETE